MKNIIKALQEEKIIYDDERNNYFSTALGEAIKLVPDNTKNLLDVGCGNGVGAVVAKKLNKKIETYYGLDFNSSAEKYALKNVDKYIKADIENLPEDLFEPNFFDVIMFNDVLEHLINPKEVVKQALKYLKPDGVMIASIPNVLHQSVLLNLLLNGNWYDQGVAVEEHVRFFTFNEIIRFFSINGLNLQENVISVFNESSPQMIAILKAIKPWIKADYDKRVIETSTIQYVITLKTDKTAENLNIIRVPNILNNL